MPLDTDRHKISAGLAVIVAMWYHLMDAVDPHLVEHAETALLQNPNVKLIEYLRMRWVGHCLHLESAIKVDRKLDISEINRLREELKNSLMEEIPNLIEMTMSIGN